MSSLKSSYSAARKPPGFAFVEFESARDADSAIRKLDGRTLHLLFPFHAQEFSSIAGWFQDLAFGQSCCVDLPLARLLFWLLRQYSKVHPSLC